MQQQQYFLATPRGSDQADEWIKLGIEAQIAAQQIPDVDQRNGKFAQSEAYYRKALAIEPRNAMATLNLGILYAQIGNINEGLMTVERAAMFDGVYPVVHANRAMMCAQAERIEEALAVARYAVALAKEYGPSDEDRAGYVQSRMALAMLAGGNGFPEEAISVYGEIIAVERNTPTGHAAATNRCFAQTLTSCGTEELCWLRKEWYETFKVKAEEKKPHANERNPDRPLRVGYVGGDFKQHSASMIFANVILNHSPAVEVYIYSSLPVDRVNDPYTKRYAEKAGERWRDVTTMTDEQLDAKIREDRIDVLVDLAAHTAGSRLSVFCRKPAPVSCTAWGFAHGTGVPEIDYFLADAICVPDGEVQHFAEKVWNLPCSVTYLPPEWYGLKGTSRLPSFANEHFTFGCFARYEKLSDESLRVFAEILRRVPDSKIIFKDHAIRRPYSIRRILQVMGDIPIDRILPGISTSHQDHLLSYQQADLVLNPFPHSSGVVCLEQLWMGVPLVTLYGNQPGGRTAASVLACMGRQEWIARTPEEYVEKAVELATGNPQILAKARKTLRDELLASPVVAGYAAAVENAYREMWKEWVNR